MKAFQTRDYPLCIHIGSLIGRPRNWAGFENIGVLAYDDPALFEEIIETICVCGCAMIERALKDVTPDFGAGWEDICFKNGPISARRCSTSGSSRATSASPTCS